MAGDELVRRKTAMNVGTTKHSTTERKKDSGMFESSPRS
jgi:hypothetical protein